MKSLILSLLFIQIGCIGAGETVVYENRHPQEMVVVYDEPDHKHVSVVYVEDEDYYEFFNEYGEWCYGETNPYEPNCFSEWCLDHHAADWYKWVEVCEYNGEYHGYY